MKKYFKTTIIVVIILTLIIPAVIRSVAQSKKDKTKHTTVRIEQVKEGQLSEFVSAPGEIEPKRGDHGA